LLRHWFPEPLRLGTPHLLEQLRQHGHSIWIYTTSGRSPGYVKRWLRFYSICVEGVINQEQHDEVVRPRNFRRHPSKYPPAFGIELHVDDSAGVGMEGAELGFRTVIVSPDDQSWSERVLAAVEEQIDNSVR
jgi:nicotinamidase-related amidase